jgi:1,4-alpha-glucan branching enzyme
MSKPATISTDRTGELCRTEFRCHAPSATSVFLAASFNNWDARATVLSREGDGHWSVEVDLAPGFYHYKYVIDGRWCCEPTCPSGCGGNLPCERCVPNAYGTMDRVRVVG